MNRTEELRTKRERLVNEFRDASIYTQFYRREQLLRDIKAHDVEVAHENHREADRRWDKDRGL